MRKVDAFKCEITGAIFEDEVRATRSEFYAMMKRTGRSLPPMGSLGADAIMDWLARAIESEVYPTIVDRLQEALCYYQENVRPRVAPKSKEDAA